MPSRTSSSSRRARSRRRREGLHRLHAVLAPVARGGQAGSRSRSLRAFPRPPPSLSPAFPSIPLGKVRGFRETGAPQTRGAGPPRPGGRGTRSARPRSCATRESATGRTCPGTSRLSPHLRFGTIGVRRVLAEARAAWKDASPPGRRGSNVREGALLARVLRGNPPRVSARPDGELPEGVRRVPVGLGRRGRTALRGVGRGPHGLPDRRRRDAPAPRRGLDAQPRADDRRVLPDEGPPRDWRRGEAFFRRHLADGDPASNNGGWQWAAGSGTDAQPFFRIFNPVLQGRTFDPGAAYVKAVGAGARGRRRRARGSPRAVDAREPSRGLPRARRGPRRGAGRGARRVRVVEEKR
jgi:deoxyribodipyrimidine photo-lyase